MTLTITTITTVKIRPQIIVPLNESSGFPIVFPLSPELNVNIKNIILEYFNSKQTCKYIQSSKYSSGA
jgi:hypothetical protein